VTIARPQRVALPATLIVTMTAGVFQLYIFSVLAAPLIDDLDISRTQLGLIGAVNTAAGAASSPFLGRLTDRLGAARSVVASLSLSALGMAALAVAPTLAWILLAAAIGGLPQGWSNPATNHLISARVAVGTRGTLTGIKQSGVTLGMFLAGVTLPTIEGVAGWRGAAWTFSGVFAVAAVAVHLALDADQTPADAPHGIDGATPRLQPRPIASIVRWIAPYAFLMGLATGSIGRFVPLYAEESLGFSTSTAGLIVALGGLCGMGARITAARIAEHRISPTRLLTVLSIVGAGYCLLLALLTPSTSVLLWLSPPLNAIGTNAWNAVAMMAVIMFVATSDAGRASGIIMFGFLGGLAVSGPIAGAVIDQSGYRPVWIGAMTVSAAAAVLMFVADRRHGAVDGSAR
jgi:predicted MFS family arabinose efflux permease